MNPPDEEPKIKGSVIKDPRDWTREAYGEEAYRAALESLRPEERKLIDGQLFPAFWYPIETWDYFMAAMRREAHARVGHSEQEFDMRNMREAGSVVVRTIYRFVLGLMNPRSVLEKGMVIYSRAYNQGRFELRENAPGRAVVRFSGGSPKFRENLTHMLPTGLTFLLELSGAKEPKASISFDEVVDGKLTFEVTMSYTP